MKFYFWVSFFIQTAALFPAQAQFSRIILGSPDLELNEAQVVGSVRFENLPKGRISEWINDPHEFYITTNGMILFLEGMRTNYPFGDLQGKGVECTISLFSNEAAFRGFARPEGKWLFKYIDKNLDIPVCEPIFNKFKASSPNSPVKVLYKPALMENNWILDYGLFFIP